MDFLSHCILEKIKKLTLGLMNINSFGGTTQKKESNEILLQLLAPALQAIQAKAEQSPACLHLESRVHLQADRQAVEGCVRKVGGMSAPLAIDLFCGLGGWTEGLLAEGYDVIGFDNERHQYGDAKYPAQLVLQDVLTLHGKQFKDVDLIVASPPCQEYSYMAMPWSRAKQIEREYLDGTRDKANLTALFDACFRIQREACEAAGHFIPLVVENVRGAQKWVGRSRWNYGSFHLWGDVPALMPMTGKVKGSGFNLSIGGDKWSTHHAEFMETHCGVKVGSGPDKRRGAKSTAALTRSYEWTNPAENGVKHYGGHSIGVPYAQRSTNSVVRTASGSKARKAASAMIAKIPLPLSRHIAAYWKNYMLQFSA